MNTNQINELLDKYFEGETSITEERTLKSYFNSDEVTPEHLPYSDLFNYYSLAQTEILEKELYLNDVFSPRPSRLRLIKNYAVSIAAALALVLASIFIIKTQITTANDARMAQVEIEDPEEALEATMEALAYLGIQFNKGTESMDKIKALSKAQIIK